MKMFIVLAMVCSAFSAFAIGNNAAVTLGVGQAEEAPSSSVKCTDCDARRLAKMNQNMNFNDKSKGVATNAEGSRKQKKH